MCNKVEPDKKMNDDREKIRFLRDASQAWLSVAELPNRDNEVFILSPYVTGDIIEEITRASIGKTIHLITAFNSNSVVSKSLDLSVLQQLLKRGVKIYSHPSLHAKILINGNQAVIGSQNFTKGGKFNKEASLQLSLSSSERDELNEFINEILSEAKYITKKDIDDFFTVSQIYSEKLSDLKFILNKLNNYFDKEKNKPTQSKTLLTLNNNDPTVISGTAKKNRKEHIC